MKKSASKSKAKTAKNEINDSPALKYASFWRRFLAFFLDGIILAVIAFIVKIPFNLMDGVGAMGVYEPVYWQESTGFRQIGTYLSWLVDLAYYLYFIGKKGATPGKMALHIKVVLKNAPKTEIGYLKAFLREYVGKFVSTIAIGLGYLWMIWDRDKQTWHDKIAGTVVIRSK